MNHIANLVLAGLVVFAGMAAPSSQVTLTRASEGSTPSNCTQLNHAHGAGHQSSHIACEKR